MTNEVTLFLTQRWWRLVRQLDDCYSGQSVVIAESATQPLSRRTARLLFEECVGDRARRDLAMLLPPGWARFLDLDRPDTWKVLERLAALPPAGRFAEAMRGEITATTDLVFAVLDLAETVAASDRASASSLAQTALALSLRLAGEGADCRRVIDEQAVYWIRDAEEELFHDRIHRVAVRLDLAQSLIEGGAGDPTLAARLGIVRAQFFWQQAQIEPCLVELEAALLFCDAAGDRGLRGCALFLRGVTLATVGRLGEARLSFEECLVLLPGSREEWLISGVEEYLHQLGWPTLPGIRG